MVRGTWKRGHKARFEARGTCADGMRLLPGPDADDDELDEDMGLLDPGPPPEPTRSETWQRQGTSNTFVREGDGATTTLNDLDDLEDLAGYGPPDPPPGHIGGKPDRSGGRPRASKVRVTATVKRDIEAKVGLMLEIPGRVWQARDPYCGGQFVAQLPAVRPALTELICQSSDLVEFFTGVGGGFMLWLNLITALQPVLVTIYAHHVSHSIAEVEQEPRDMSRYAA